MVYKVIGIMSGSSLDGVDIAYVELQEQQVTQRQGSRSWGFAILQAKTEAYSAEWRLRLAGAPGLSAREWLLLHAEYGRYLGERVNAFIEEYGLQFRVQLIASHGHTSFHDPARRMTAQLGDGAAIAAATRINVVSDLRAMDVALGGQGAPIVPIGERLLLPGYDLYLNLGGIANISLQRDDRFLAFDVCPANRVLNALATLEGRPYDEGGSLAKTGRLDPELLQKLNALPYYALPYPKSLANEVGTETVLPMVRQAMTDRRLSAADALRTYTEHIAAQVSLAAEQLLPGATPGRKPAMARNVPEGRMLVTGGGAHNDFLVDQIRRRLDVEVTVPEEMLVDYKEALVMALIGVLRWREENNVLASVTGASRDSIGGAVWIGQEA